MSPKMIEQARVNHAGSGVRFAIIELLVSTWMRCPATRFSTRSCVQACSKYLHDVPNCVRSLAGALRPGGWLLATVPNIHHPVRRGEAWHRILMGSKLATCTHPIDAKG